MAPITKNKKIITAVCITIFAIIFMIADIIHYNNQPIIYNTLPGGHPANYIIIDPKSHRYAETTLSKKAAIKAAHNLPESTYKANDKHSILYYNEKSQEIVFNNVGEATKSGNSWRLDQDDDIMWQNYPGSVPVGGYAHRGAKIGKFRTYITTHNGKISDTPYTKWHGAHHWQKMQTHRVIRVPLR